MTTERNYTVGKSKENTRGVGSIIYFTNGRAEPAREGKKAQFQVIKMTFS